MTSLLAYVLVLFQKLKHKVRVRSGGVSRLWDPDWGNSGPQMEKTSIQTPHDDHFRLACCAESYCVCASAGGNPSSQVARAHQHWFWIPQPGPAGMFCCSTGWAQPTRRPSESFRATSLANPKRVLVPCPRVSGETKPLMFDWETIGPLTRRSKGRLCVSHHQWRVLLLHLILLGSLQLSRGRCTSTCTSPCSRGPSWPGSELF